jgi:hypothetical protein
VAGINLCPQYGQIRTFRPTVSSHAGQVFIPGQFMLRVWLGVNGEVTGYSRNLPIIA